MSRRTRILCAIGAILGLSIVATADAAPKGKKPRKPVPAPAPAPTPAPGPSSGSFDKDAAASALSSVDLTKCRATNAEKGDGHVVIVFAPAGSVSEATIDKGPWVGTPVAKCMTSQFSKTKIPSFSGEPVKVGKNFKFE